MKTEIAVLSSSMVPAVREFNARMAAAGVTPGFAISDDAAAFEAARRDPAVVRTEQFVVLENNVVRGGYLLQEFPFWVFGREHPVVGCQMPISEGIVDKRFTHIAPLMLKRLQRDHPMAFALGMGSADHPFARLLNAMKWRVSLAPLLFRVNNGSKFLREIKALRSTASRRLPAQVAAYSGIGAVSLRAAHAIKTKTKRDASFRVEQFTDWGGWADELWLAARDGYAISCVRNSRFLRYSYPQGDRYLAYCVKHNGKPIGLFVLLQKSMSDDRHFGNLCVGTVLDCFGIAGHAPQIALAATAELQNLGVDLIVTNQTHTVWVQAFREGGYLDGPSNYVVALSPGLVTSGASSNQIERVHITRGDGDGRINL